MADEISDIPLEMNYFGKIQRTEVRLLGQSSRLPFGGRAPSRSAPVPAGPPLRTPHFAVHRKTGMLRNARLCKTTALMGPRGSHVGRTDSCIMQDQTAKHSQKVDPGK